MARAPSLFISRGAPTFALEPGRAGPALGALGRTLPRPAASPTVCSRWTPTRSAASAWTHDGRPRHARPLTARPPARCAEVVQGVLGTTFGMMLAKVPAIVQGDGVAQTVSMRLAHGIAPAVFAVPGVLTLPNVGTLF